MVYQPVISAWRPAAKCVTFLLPRLGTDLQRVWVIHAHGPETRWKPRKLYLRPIQFNKCLAIWFSILTLVSSAWITNKRELIASEQDIRAWWKVPDLLPMLACPENLLVIHHRHKFLFLLLYPWTGYWILELFQPQQRDLKWGICYVCG